MRLWYMAARQGRAGLAMPDAGRALAVDRNLLSLELAALLHWVSSPEQRCGGAPPLSCSRKCQPAKDVQRA